MKYIIILSILGILINTSCKKNFACECKGVKIITFDDTSEPPITQSIFETKEIKEKEIKEKESKAKISCSNFGAKIQGDYSEETDDYIANATIDCELK